MRKFSSRFLMFAGSLTLLYGSSLPSLAKEIDANSLLPFIKGIIANEPKDSLNLMTDSLKATNNANGNWWSDFSRLKNGPLKDISIGGYYRFLGFYRRQPTPMAGVFGNNFIRQGDGYREPLLNLNITGRPSSTTAFGTDIYFFSDFQGPANIDTTGSVSAYRGLSLNLGLNLYGSINTDVGTFNVRLGGIHWYSLSPFTMGQNRGYNRYSVFDRSPWEAVTRGNDRYTSYYNANSLRQDGRWDKQAFQGIILEAVRLPNNFDASILFGKTVFNSGALFTTGAVPNLSYGGRLQKSFNGNYVSYNHFTSKTFQDSIKRTSFQTQIHTTEFLLNLKGITLEGELGLGSFTSIIGETNYSLAHSYKLKLPARLTKIPIELHYFRIGKNFVNVNSNFINTSIAEAQPRNNVNPFSSPMLDVGQLSNNRTGLNLNTEFVIGSVKIDVGNNIATEINNLNNKLSFSHRVNGLAWSRFYFYDFDPGSFPNSNVGPYNRLTTFFRGAYEIVNLGGDTSNGLPKKYFNALDVHLKMSQRIAGKELMIFFLSSTNSVQPKFSVIPNFSASSWIRAYYNELDLSYPLFKRTTVLGYLGFERVIGNYETDIDEVSGKPRDQYNNAYGLGVDIDVAEGVGLYLRHRWYNYKDLNFERDRFVGTESTIELKLFF